MSRANRRRVLLATGALALVALGTVPLLTQAQVTGRPARIVWLVQALWQIRPEGLASMEPFIEALKQGLQALGHIEGKTFVFERRFSSGKAEDLPDLKRELAAFQPDVIVVNEQFARFAQQAAPNVPLVLNYSQDPVASGLAKSLARPGGNVTASRPSIKI